ncbi:MAG: hypothetical protein RLZZ241_2306 [Bacteroidota bacterium]|jgi:transcription antitermination factor NusG
MNWYALLTKPRNELKVCEHLNNQGIIAYAPSYVEIRQWSDRKKKLRIPYFPSYVFVRLADAERSQAFCHPGVLRYVYWQGKPAIIRDQELEMIQAYLEGKEKQEFLVEQLQIGDPVVLLRGGFKNNVAYVERLGSRKIRLVFPSLGFKITTLVSDVSPFRKAS